MDLQTFTAGSANLLDSLLFSRWGSERTKVKFRILYRNSSERIPGYGVTIPRHIAKNYLHITHFNISQSGNAIILLPLQNGNT